MREPAAEAFRRHLCARMSDWLRAIPPEIAADICALSLWIYVEEDEPPQFVADLSCNTEARVAAMADQASDAGEARWNFAFWLQQPSLSIGSADDEAGMAARQQWLADAGFAEQLATAGDQDREFEICDAIEGEFCEIVATAARELHDSGLLADLFGRSVPIILHDLEFHEGTVDLATAANPPEVIRPFVEWVDSLADDD